MIDLTTKALPNTVEVDGELFSIETDFRLWLKYSIEISKLLPGERYSVAYLFKNEIPTGDIITALNKFAFPKADIPRQMGENSNEIILDYEIDADLIYAAFLGQYGVDLLTAELHWYQFVALLKGINETTKLREVMGYRSYKKETRKNVDVYEELKQAWQIIPSTPYMDEEAKAFSDLFTPKE